MFIHCKPSTLSAILTCACVAALTGCGTDTPIVCGGTSVAPAATTLASLQVAPLAPSLSLYPGQTASFPVQVEAPVASTVTVSVEGLPSGLTVAPVTVTGGGTVPLSFVSSVTLATECFAGAYLDVSTTYPVVVNATSSSGTSTAGVLLNIVLQNPAYVPATTNIPRMNVTTTGNLFVVAKSTELPGTVTITDPTNAANNFSGAMTIKGHGNSTYPLPKTPYDLKLNSKGNLLGLGSNKSFILLANYTDKSLMRDYIASNLGQMFGMPWTPNSHFVELFFNNVYEGTYELSEKVNIQPNRVNIATAPAVDAPGADITGGYLLEIDEELGETFMFTTPKNVVIGSDDPDPPTTNEQAYISTTVSAAENALYADNFTDPDKGWRAYFDESTLINWYLVEELMGNEDGNFHSSDYLYKEQDNPILFMGPLWDFDVSSGNVNYSPAANPTVAWVRTHATWYQRLFQDPTFVADVKARWQVMHTQVETVPAFIDTTASNLTLASQNNYARWPTLGQKLWPNTVAAASYQGEVDFLKKWMVARIAFMDSLYLH